MYIEVKKSYNNGLIPWKLHSNNGSKNEDKLITSWTLNIYKQSYINTVYCIFLLIAEEMEMIERFTRHKILKGFKMTYT